jgi:hypothetical protein
MLDKINKTLNRLMPLVASSGVVLGFLLPGVFIHLRPFVPWLFGLITLVLLHVFNNLVQIYTANVLPIA